MKNSFKLAVAALLIAVSAAACNGNKSASGSDTTVVDSNVSKTVTIDSTVNKDTVVKTDTVVVDSTKK